MIAFSFFVCVSLFWDGFLINMLLSSSAGSYSGARAETGAGWPLCKEAVLKVPMGPCQSTTCPTVALGSCTPVSRRRLLGPHLDLVSAGLAQGRGQPGLIQNAQARTLSTVTLPLDIFLALTSF